MKVAVVLALCALGVNAGPGSARALAEALSKLQQAAFENPATGDAILRSLRSSAGKASLVSLPDYPFAEQSAHQASSPDVIHINFDVPRGASFLQTKGSDPVGDLMSSYRQIGDIMHNYEAAEAPSDSDIRNMVNAGEAGCPECSFHSEKQASVDATKPVLEVRLAAPKVAPWESLISGLTHQRQALEAKYMTMFRQMFDKQFKQARPSFAQQSGSDAIRVKVGKMQQVGPSLVSMVVENEAAKNQQEVEMLKSAISSLQQMTGSHAFLERSAQNVDFDVKVGQGSKPFARFYDAVRAMLSARRASEERIRGHIASMMQRLYSAKRA